VVGGNPCGEFVVEMNKKGKKPTIAVIGERYFFIGKKIW
jgi:hypothetical protein